MSTENSTTMEMCWKPQFESGGKNLLHLHIGNRWVPYTAAPQYAVPDHTVPNGSLGFATMQKLLRAGWKMVEAPNAER